MIIGCVMGGVPTSSVFGIRPFHSCKMRYNPVMDFEKPLVFADKEFQELDELLSSDAMPDSSMDICMLEGFLTALIVGPATLMPSQWLKFVWDREAGKDDSPFETHEELSRFVGLVFGLNNSIARVFEESPEEFEPTFYERKVKGKTYIIVDEWCMGFLTAVNLAPEAWEPLKRERPELLRPLQIFGSSAGWDELDASGDPEAMHKEWSARITPAVRGIHAFWLPYRLAGIQQELAAATRPHKIGRNDPCPCGSGKKFKKCCGAPDKVH